MRVGMRCAGLIAVAMVSGCAATSTAAAPVSTPVPTVSLAAYEPPTSAPRARAVSTVSRDEAVEGVLGFFEALNYGFATGDADPLREVSTLGCGPCVSWIQEIQRTKDAGATQVGGYVRVVEMRVIGAEEPAHTFRAALLRAPGAVTKAGAEPTAVVGSGKAELVDIKVGPQQSAITGRITWAVLDITLAPMGPSGPGTSNGSHT